MSPALLRALIAVGSMCLIYLIASIIYLIYDHNKAERQEHEKQLLFKLDELNSKIMETRIAIAVMDNNWESGLRFNNRAEAQWKDNL